MNRGKTELPYREGQRVVIEATFVKDIDYANDDGPGYVAGVMLTVAGKTVCVRADALAAEQSQDDERVSVDEDGSKTFRCPECGSCRELLPNDPMRCFACHYGADRSLDAIADEKLREMIATFRPHDQGGQPVISMHWDLWRRVLAMTTVQAEGEQGEGPLYRIKALAKSWNMALAIREGDTARSVAMSKLLGELEDAING